MSCTPCIDRETHCLWAARKMPRLSTVPRQIITQVLRDLKRAKTIPDTPTDTESGERTTITTAQSGTRDAFWRSHTVRGRLQPRFFQCFHGPAFASTAQPSPSSRDPMGTLHSTPQPLPRPLQCELFRRRTEAQKLHVLDLHELAVSPRWVTRPVRWPLAKGLVHPAHIAHEKTQYLPNK